MEAQKRIELLVVCVAVCGTGVLIGARLHKRAVERRLVSAVATDDAVTVVDLLDRGAVFRRSVRGPATLVSMACSIGAKRTLTALLRRGEHPDANDICTPALRNDVEMVEMLIRAGASPNAIAFGRFPILISLAERRKSDMIKRLVDHGADPNFGYPINGYHPRGFTALMVTASSGDITDARTLLRAGAKVDSKVADHVSDLDGYTALMIAEKHKAVDAVSLLLQFGAKTDIVAGDGMTPTALARQNEAMLRLIAGKQNVKQDESSR